MADVGHLKRTQSEHGDFGIYQGALQTFKGDFFLSVISHPRRGEQKAPTHEIFILLDNGDRRIPVGVGWERTMLRGQNNGKAMLSMSFDHPEMPEWTRNLAAFPGGSDEAYKIVHQRQRRAAAGGEAVSNDAQAPSDLDDDIPF